MGLRHYRGCYIPFPPSGENYTPQPRRSFPMSTHFVGLVIGVKGQGLWFALVLVWGKLGGDNQIRTDDPLLAKQVLYQLSYTPTLVHAL